MKPIPPLSLDLDDEDRAAHLARLRLIYKPFPRIKAFDAHPRTARWAGCGLGFGSKARRTHDENDNR